MKIDSSSGPGGPAGSTRATGGLRAVVVFVVVLALEWRFADPATVGDDPVRFAIPWAMTALLPIFMLGLWAYRVTADENPAAAGDFKIDALRGVVAATAVYVTIFLYGRLV